MGEARAWQPNLSLWQPIEPYGHPAEARTTEIWAGRLGDGKEILVMRADGVGQLARLWTVPEPSRQRGLSLTTFHRLPGSGRMPGSDSLPLRYRRGQLEPRSRPAAVTLDSGSGRQRAMSLSIFHRLPCDRHQGELGHPTSARALRSASNRTSHRYRLGRDAAGAVSMCLGPAGERQVALSISRPAAMTSTPGQRLYEYC